MISIQACFIIVIILSCLAILSLLFTTARKESYTTQQEWSEFSKYSTKEWLNQSYKLCIPRIKAECPTKGDFSCVTKSLRDCQEANKNNINQLCLQEATKKLCDRPSTNKDKCNLSISYFHQIGQFCTPPDLS